jgi:hypothetical protein
MSARTAFGVLLAATLLPAAAQTPPAPAASAPAAEAPKPRPPLKLRLDEADLRSLAPAAPKDAEKQPDTGLPSLGGRPSPALERKPSDVVPKDQTPGL